MTNIEVICVSDGDALTFAVTLRDAKSETRHRVTLSRRDALRLAPEADPAALIDAAFRFLLDREPKEAILASFDVSVIARYFPAFGKELRNYLTQGTPPAGALQSE